MENPAASPTRATVVGSGPDGRVEVVLDDGTRTVLEPAAVASLRRVHPGQRLVIAADGRAGIGTVSD